MKNKMLKKGFAIGMSAFLLASSLAPVSVQAASWKQNKKDRKSTRLNSSH